jgi:arginase
MSPFIPDKKINIIQAPVALGQGLEGVDEGPKILLDHGLKQQIESLQWNVTNIQTIDTHNLRWNSPEGLLPAHQTGVNIKFPESLGKSCAELAQLAKKSHQEHAFTLTLGGDHSIAIGSIGGALQAQPNLGVVWVDAHGDFNNPATSPSGNIHGMPLSFLTGQMQSYRLPSFSWLDHFRSIDPEERKQMKSFGVHVFSMYEVDRYGIGQVMQMAREILLGNGDRPIHLSYDIDAIDPHFAPSTGTRVRGGLNYREAHFIAENLAETGQLVSMDLVEINPRLGFVDASHREVENVTIDIGLELISSALGKRIY